MAGDGAFLMLDQTICCDSSVSLQPLGEKKTQDVSALQPLWQKKRRTIRWWRLPAAGSESVTGIRLHTISAECTGARGGKRHCVLHATVWVTRQKRAKPTWSTQYVRILNESCGGNKYIKLHERNKSSEQGKQRLRGQAQSQCHAVTQTPPYFNDFSWCG